MKSNSKNKSINTKFSKTEHRLIPSFIFAGNYLPYIISGIYFAIISFVSFSYHKVGDYGVETDFYWGYIPQAKAILKGILIIDEYKGPLYQIVLALFSLVFGGDFFRAGIFINILSATAVLFFIFKIFKIISNKEIAFITVIFTATNQYFIKYSYSCGTDMLFMVLYFLSIFCLLKSDFNEAKWMLVSGLFCALAYITRYTALSLIISVFLYFIILIIRRFRTKNLKTREKLSGKIKNIYLFFIPNLVFVIAWGIICLIYKGSFFYNNNFLNTSYTVYKTGDISNADWVANYQSQFHSMKDVVFRDFGLFVKRIFIENFSSYFVNDMKILLSWYVGIFASAGLIFFLFKFKKINFLVKFYFFLSIIFYFFTILIFYSERFTLLLLPLYFYFISNLLFITFLQKNRLKKRGIALISLSIVTALFIINFYNSFFYVKEDIASGNVDILLVSEWVKNHYNDGLNGKTVAARKPHIAYYTNSIFMPLTGIATVNELVSKLKQSNVDYLFSTAGELSPRGIMTKSLLDPDNPPDGLEPIFSSENHSCVLFKVKK
jgi:hypothetical protein